MVASRESHQWHMLSSPVTEESMTMLDQMNATSTPHKRGALE
jgi:hypothetical protein